MKNDELLHKWINGTISEEELALFKLRPEYESLTVLYQNTEQLSTAGFDEDSMLSEILKTKKEASPQMEKSRRRILTTWVKYAAAASVLLVATWFFWPKNSRVVYEIAKGERKEGVLPDESTFVLNAESTLSYDAKKWEEGRNLDLKGEAFFKVKKGSKFSVNTLNGSVQVLGTEFNVWSRKETLEVKCQSGKVVVLSASGQLLETLNPNDAIRIVAGKETEKWVLQTANQVTWLKGISSFKKVKLEVVLEELERQFTISIDANQVNTQEIISCNFQHQDLNLALKTTLSPLKIKYEIKDNQRVYLTKE